jgi:hypothetical protein
MAWAVKSFVAIVTLMFVTSVGANGRALYILKRGPHANERGPYIHKNDKRALHAGGYDAV